MLIRPRPRCDVVAKLLSVEKPAYQVKNRRILSGVDLAETEIHALIRANGTGKSTLAYLVMACVG